MRCGAGGRGKEERKREGGRDCFKCLAYPIVFTLLFCSSAPANAVAPGSPMLLLPRLRAVASKQKPQLAFRSCSTTHREKEREGVSVCVARIQRKEERRLIYVRYFRWSVKRPKIARD